MASSLTVHALGVRYGGVQALADLDITVEAGEVVGLIGPNGAGKTSAIDAMSGYATPSSGRVELDGADVTSWSAHRRARAGLARTFQQLELFNDLTVEDNVVLAARSCGRGDENTLARWMELFDLEGCRRSLVSELPQGVRRMVAIARAAASHPSALLLDEPAAGLDNHESELLSGRLRDLAAGGSAVLLVEHDMALVMAVCDRVVVIDFGVTIASGTPDEVRNDPRVIDAYLGIEKATSGA